MKLLIANRGEIALRIARTARRLGHEVLGIYSSADRGLPHLRLCHRAIPLEGDPLQVYLDQNSILTQAQKLGATAIHPGYGFLSENGSFAQKVEAAGLHFVGPTAQQIAALGDKIAARKAASDAGIPTVPGTLEAIEDLQQARKIALEIGCPVLVKAAAGGGGRGMRVVEDINALQEAIERASSEAKAAFGDGRVFIEKYFTSVRHIEIQVLGDGKGLAIALGERDCSVQRRHQKLIEESPTPGLPPHVVSSMEALAAKLAGSIRYRGAGTMEFLVPSGSSDFYFIEMNTRLQVEHPVTEMRFGIDLVEEQLRVAQGLSFSFGDERPQPQGWAIEARIIAEDFAANFRPSLGRLQLCQWPAGPGIRVDAWAEPQLEITPYYDSLLGKVIAWGRCREEAIQRLQLALSETLIAPVISTAPFIAELIGNQPFRSGNYDTGILKERWHPRPDTKALAHAGVLAAAEHLLRADRSGVQRQSYRGRNLSAWQREQ